MIRKNRIKKLISSVLIMAIILPTVLFSQPQKADAFSDLPAFGQRVFTNINTFLTKTFGAQTAVTSAATAGWTIKQWAEYLGQQFLRGVAKKVLAEITQSTVNWINRGFHGSPLFLENPQSFFKDIGKFEVKQLVDMIGYDSFRFPFGKDTALQIIDSYKRRLADNSQYTLSKVINDPDLLVRYRNDFNVGGWNGFLINTQYPQNNYLGYNMIIQQNLASRLEGTLMAPAQKIKDTLQQGMGFLSPETCADNNGENAYNSVMANAFNRPSFKTKVEYTPPPNNSGDEGDENYLHSLTVYNTQYEEAVASDKNVWAETNTCKNLVKTTPGSVAANQVMFALNIPNQSKILDGAFGNSLSAIFDALLNKFVGDGLKSAANNINPRPAQQDNWSYNPVGGGSYTLSDDNNNTGEILNLNIQSVSITEGEETRTVISGGIGNYGIQTQPNSNVATVSITNATSTTPATLTVAGKLQGAGHTSVVIKDSTTPTPKTARVEIEVNYAGALVVRPIGPPTGTPPRGTITTDTENPKIVNIYGGTTPYEIQVVPNRAVAIASLAGTSLIITGVGNGKTSFVIQDSSTLPDSATPFPQTLTVNIEIRAPEDLVIEPNVSVEVGDDKAITKPIIGGTSEFKISAESSLDETVATVDIIPGTNNTYSLKITGKKPGNTSVAIEDSSYPAKIVGVNITVTDPSNPTVTCLINGNINDISQSECTGLGGSFLP